MPIYMPILFSKCSIFNFNCMITINAEPAESLDGTLCGADQSLALPTLAISSTFASVSNAFSTRPSNATQTTQISVHPGATPHTKVNKLIFITRVCNTSDSNKHAMQSTKSVISKRRQTVVSSFRGSLLDLIGRLSACTPHFVRCGFKILN